MENNYKLFAENQKTVSRKTGPPKSSKTHLKANKCLFLFSCQKRKKKSLPETRSENANDLNIQATKMLTIRVVIQTVRQTYKTCSSKKRPFAVKRSSREEQEFVFGLFFSYGNKPCSPGRLFK